MQSSIPVLGALKGLPQVLNLAQFVLLDGHINADHILPNNAPSTNVQMSDLGIAHKAIWKTDGVGRSFELSEALREFGLLISETVHVWGLGGGNGIAIFGRRLGGNAPSVYDD
jgi:hypothetical protein